MDPLIELSNQTTRNQIHGLAYHMACAAYNFLYNSSLESMYNFSDPPYIHMSSVPIFELTIKEGWTPTDPRVKKINLSAYDFKRGNVRGPFVISLLDSSGKNFNMIEQSTLEDIFDFLTALTDKKPVEKIKFNPPAELEPFVAFPKKREKKKKKKVELIPGLWK